MKRAIPPIRRQPEVGKPRPDRTAAGIINPGLTIEQRIKDIVRCEIDIYDVDTEQKLANLNAFRAAFREPKLVTVNFSGGITQKCWSITSSDGTYRVVYMPNAGYFSLCVESDLGLLDIGVHGPAIGCFCSV